MYSLHAIHIQPCNVVGLHNVTDIRKTEII